MGGTASDYGVANKTFGVYAFGFILCIFLTLVPFYAVMHSIASYEYLAAIILVSALAQFFVQIICFLRLNTKTEQGKINVWSFIFTGFVAFVVIAGSVWIMCNLNYFMMH
jgi:cytochrome o ubiquinol oxidase subunit IV